MLLISVPASAGPPPPAPISVSLNCTGTGTYSFIEGLSLYDAKGNPLESGINLECGTANDPFPSDKGYPNGVGPLSLSAKVGGYSYSGNWYCANPAAPGGGGSFAFGVTSLKGKRPFSIRCLSPTSTNGSEVFLTIG